MIDHDTIRLLDLDAGRRFCTQALELLDFSDLRTEGDGFIEWNDFSIAQASAERPATRRLHVAFQASSRAAGRRLVAGHDRGRLPRRRRTGSAAAVLARLLRRLRNRPGRQQRRSRPPRPAEAWRCFGCASRAWPTPLASTKPSCPSSDTKPRRVPTAPPSTAMAPPSPLVEGEPSANVHLAFVAPDQATVNDFHQAGVNAGYTSLGAPGERPEYHPRLLRRLSPRPRRA
jgi:hypothetical protein